MKRRTLLLAAPALILPRKANAIWTKLSTFSSVSTPSTWPNASNTGVPAGTSLTPSGSITTSTNNQIIDAMDVTGQITVNHSGVTIKNTQVTWNADKPIIVHGPNCTIQDTTVIGVDASVSKSGIVIGEGSSADGCQVLRCNIGFVENMLWIEAADNGLLQDSYMHDAAGPGHQDGIQAAPFLAHVVGWAYRHNNFSFEGSTTLSSCYTDTAAATNGTLDNNRMVGSQELGQLWPVTHLNGDTFSITNNIIYGNFESTGTNLTYSGNFEMDNPTDLVGNPAKPRNPT